MACLVMVGFAMVGLAAAGLTVAEFMTVRHR
jgi:hypothetical protein